MISLEILKILTPLQKLPQNVGDLGKLIVAKALKNRPKSDKSPNLFTLSTVHDVRLQLYERDSSLGRMLCLRSCHLPLHSKSLSIFGRI